MKNNAGAKKIAGKFHVLRFTAIAVGILLLIALIGILTLVSFSNAQVPGFLASDGPVQAIVTVGGMLFSFTARGLLIGAGVLAVLLAACVVAYCYCRKKVNQQKAAGAADKN